MKAHYRTANGRLTFELTGENVKALFKELSLVQEVFDADSACGMCKSTDLAFRARSVDEFDFYELGCRACFARLQFGQAKKGGGLFPKRKTEDGAAIPNRGWTKFEKNGKAVGNDLDHHLRDEDVTFDPGPAPPPRSGRR